MQLPCVCAFVKEKGSIKMTINITEFGGKKLSWQAASRIGAIVASENTRKFETGPFCFSQCEATTEHSHDAVAVVFSTTLVVLLKRKCELTVCYLPASVTEARKVSSEATRQTSHDAKFPLSSTKPTSRT